MFYHKHSSVEPPNKGHFGNGPLVLCSEVVPISEIHDFSTHFDCIILNKLVNALKSIIEMIIKLLVCSVFSINIAQAEFLFLKYWLLQNRYLDSRLILLSRMQHNIATA